MGLSIVSRAFAKALTLSISEHLEHRWSHLSHLSRMEQSTQKCRPSLAVKPSKSSQLSSSIFQFFGNHSHRKMPQRNCKPRSIETETSLTAAPFPQRRHLGTFSSSGRGPGSQFQDLLTALHTNHIPQWALDVSQPCHGKVKLCGFKASSRSPPCEPCGKEGLPRDQWDQA